MFRQQKDWETRENAFAAFTMGPLTDFWHQREEAEFRASMMSRYALFAFAPKKTIGSWSSVRGVLKAT
jgi:hypothetical protein